MEDLRNSDWQAIQVLLMLLVTVKEDRTALRMLTPASQRGNTETGTCALPSAHFSSRSQASRTHRAPELAPTPGVNPSSAPGCCCPSSQQCFAHKLHTKEQLSTKHSLRTLLFGLLSPSGMRPKPPAEARSTPLIRAPGEAQKTGPWGIHAHWGRGKTGFLYYTGIILHLFTDKKKVSLY